MVRRGRLQRPSTREGQRVGLDPPETTSMVWRCPPHPHYQVAGCSGVRASNVKRETLVPYYHNHSHQVARQKSLDRTPSRFRGILSGGASPNPPRATGSSPAARLPLEVVEIITAHLTYETDSLFACSLTCYSWYIATTPHLHHTLITTTHDFETDDKFVWPRPLRDMHKFGLLPLIKKFHVRGKDYHVNGFSPRLFDYHIMRHWLPSLTNVQELGIEYLNIPEFMSTIPRYFGHLLPTVRSLALRAPKGSRRQIICFIGLFQHL